MGKKMNEEFYFLDLTIAPSFFNDATEQMRKWLNETETFTGPTMILRLVICGDAIETGTVTQERRYRRRRRRRRIRRRGGQQKRMKMPSTRRDK